MGPKSYRSEYCLSKADDIELIAWGRGVTGKEHARVSVVLFFKTGAEVVPETTMLPSLCMNPH